MGIPGGGMNSIQAGLPRPLQRGEEGEEGGAVVRGQGAEGFAGRFGFAAVPQDGFGEAAGAEQPAVDVAGFGHAEALQG